MVKQELDAIFDDINFQTYLLWKEQQPKNDNKIVFALIHSGSLTLFKTAETLMEKARKLGKKSYIVACSKPESTIYWLNSSLAEQ